MADNSQYRYYINISTDFHVEKSNFARIWPDVTDIPPENPSRPYGKICVGRSVPGF